MRIIRTEPMPRGNGPALTIVVLALASLCLVLLTACGSPKPAKIAPAANTTACNDVGTWAQSTSGPGELGEMQAAIHGITGDLKAGDPTQLQADGLALSQITGMDVVADAPPVKVSAWAAMVLDLNKAGTALVGGDDESAGELLSGAHTNASAISSALHACGVG